MVCEIKIYFMKVFVLWPVISTESMAKILGSLQQKLTLC